MTEDRARAALATSDRPGGLERWIAAQPWQAAPGGWVVLARFRDWRFRLEVGAGGVWVLASDGWGEPAAWFVPA